MDPQTLIGNKFYTADVVSLYTNIKVDKAIQNVIDMFVEHRDEINMYGLNPTQLHEMLETVFHHSYFSYNKHVYLQILGLFMGCIPSPILAVCRVHMFECASIYTDINFITNYFYKIYIDDAGSTAHLMEEAQLRMDKIAEQDEDKLLKWELDFPSSPDKKYTAFLRSEVRIAEDGTVQSRLYQK